LGHSRYRIRRIEMAEQAYDTIIMGGTVVSGQGGFRADVGISGGRIETVAADLSGAPAARTIDASGKLVLPGVVDPHVHPVYEDDITGLSKVGIFGGVTTTVAFVGPNPAWGLKATTLSEVTAEFIERGEREAMADFALHGVVIGHDDVVPQIPRLVEMGVISIKFFMMYKKRGMMLADDQILRVMDAMRDSGALAMIHAENGSAIDYLTDKLSSQPQVGNDAYLAAHRDLLEAEAMFRAVALAEAARCPLYIPHVAVKEGVEVVRPFKRSLPAPLFLETCPHYLVLTNEEVLERGALAKIAPPIRERHDNEALWEAIRDGVIDTVGTDHCGIRAETKLNSKHILDARFGAPGIEYLLPIIYSEGVRGGRISLGRMVRVMCENPARIFGLYPRKGAIVPGADADLVLFDPDQRRVCSAETGHSAAGYSLYEGMETVGAPVTVMQRGRLLLENGNLLAKPGDGRYMPGTSPDWASLG
jgi:dihydropyrimidinase